MASTCVTREAEASSAGCRTFQAAYDAGIVSLSTLRFVKHLGFAMMSPVQEAVIPVIVRKRQDVAVEACTGSGKTLAFLIPCVEILTQVLQKEGQSTSAHCRVGALCLAPTRELAMQIHSVLQVYLDHVNEAVATDADISKISTKLLSSLVFTGGYDVERDVRVICRENNRWAKRTIVVATPGRLCTLIEQLHLNTDWSFRELEVLIFDEADRLLVNSTSFETQLSTILAVLPKQRRTGLFSATLSNELRTLVKAGMRNPLSIRIRATATSSPSMQSSSQSQLLSPGSLPEASNESLQHHTFPEEVFPTPTKPGKKCILFFLTCSWADYFYKLLVQLQSRNTRLQQSTLVRLFGKMSQRCRNSAHRRFTKAPSEQGSLLFATDVAARGLDFSDVSWIVQYDAPTDPAMYVHRVGRTARAGRSGQSLLFLCPPEEAYVPFLRNRQVSLSNFAAKGGEICHRVLQLSLKNTLQFSAEAVDDTFTTACKEDYAASVEASATSAPMQDIISVCRDDDEWAWTFCRLVILQDRDYLLKAAAAFVSFIRAYKEHHLQFIFLFTELEVGQLATSLALLRLPRVKEILGRRIEGFVQSTLDPKLIAFKDKRVEERWNQIRGERKAASKTSEKKTPAQMTRRRTHSDQRRAKRRRAFEDMEALRAEECLYKKFKKGKITAAVYERLLKEVSRKFANGSDQEEVGAASDVASSDTSTTVVEHSSVGDDDL